MAKRARRRIVVSSKAKEIDEQPAIAPAKRRGRKSHYSDAQKAAFIEAIKSSRKMDADWGEILDAARTNGFVHGLPYLKKLAVDGGVVKHKKRIGRPKGSKNVSKPAQSKKRAVSNNGAGLEAIDAIVNRLVAKRLSAKVNEAIVALEKATNELRNS